MIKNFITETFWGARSNITGGYPAQFSREWFRNKSTKLGDPLRTQPIPFFMENLQSQFKDLRDEIDWFVVNHQKAYPCEYWWQNKIRDHNRELKTRTHERLDLSDKAILEPPHIIFTQKNIDILTEESLAFLNIWKNRIWETRKTVPIESVQFDLLEEISDLHFVYLACTVDPLRRLPLNTKITCKFGHTGRPKSRIAERKTQTAMAADSDNDCIPPGLLRKCRVSDAAQGRAVEEEMKRLCKADPGLQIELKRGKAGGEVVTGIYGKIRDLFYEAYDSVVEA